MNNPLVSVEVLRYNIKRSKCENKGIVLTEMELELEQTQQGDSNVHTLEDPTFILEILSRRFFLRLNLPDHSKRRQHDTDTSGSSQPPAPQSSAWKKSDTRDAPSSSFKQQSGPHDEQPIEDIPILDSANISDSEDTGSAHLPHVKPKPEWLKPIPEDDRPATSEPA
ncbi:hypothetical protein Tco_1171465 [Tanacetum coccineum]